MRKSVIRQPSQKKRSRREIKPASVGDRGLEKKRGVIKEKLNGAIDSDETMEHLPIRHCQDLQTGERRGKGRAKGGVDGRISVGEKRKKYIFDSGRDRRIRRDLKREIKTRGSRSGAKKKEEKRK